MKPGFLRLLAILLIVVISTSCSKDEPTPDYNKLLTAHTWTEANTKFDTTDPHLLEMLEMYKVLLENSEMQYNKNGTYKGDFGSGTWELSSDNKKILFDQKTYNKEEWSIHEIEQNSLKVSFTRAFVDLENQVHNVKIYLDLVPKQ